MTDLGSGMLILLSIPYQPFYQPLFTGRAMAGVSATVATSGSTSMHMPISTVATHTRPSLCGFQRDSDKYYEPSTRGGQKRQGMYNFRNV